MLHYAKDKQRFGPVTWREQRQIAVVLRRTGPERVPEPCDSEALHFARTFCVGSRC